jgi:hypothetical protein
MYLWLDLKKVNILCEYNYLMEKIETYITSLAGKVLFPYNQHRFTLPAAHQSTTFHT